jgi:ABC-type dipeptide/oligopeptide/nickel transport system ATPase subunit
VKKDQDGMENNKQIETGTETETETETDPQEPFLLQVPGEKLKIGTDQVVMILSPSGSGKSTLIQQFARQAKKANKPVALIHFRFPDDSNNNNNNNNDDNTAAVRLIQVVKQFGLKTGYPAKQSLISKILQNGIDPLVDAQNRLFQGFHLLFQVANELYEESGKNKTKCVLIFDDIHDLIKERRLADAGGKGFFHQLVTISVLNCVDLKNVDVIMAGSSCELKRSFNDSFGKKGRVNFFDLQDPLPEIVQKALIEKTHCTEEEAKKIINVCGTRLRLLNKALKNPAAAGTCKFNVDAFVSTHVDEANSSIAELLNELNSSSSDSSSDDRLVAIEALDRILDGKSEGVRFIQLPKSVRTCKTFADVFYHGIDGYLRFQNRSIEWAWQNHRKSIIAHSVALTPPLPAPLPAPIFRGS